MHRGDAGSPDQELSLDFWKLDAASKVDLKAAAVIGGLANKSAELEGGGGR